jgi:serine protease Do
VSGPPPTTTSTSPSCRWTREPQRPSPGSPATPRASALANPGGRGLRATLGFVTSEGRSFRGPRGRRIAGAIEHTAALPRGSSGGPLVDVEGRLLGLNALRLDGGLILAVPATASVKERAQALARGETPASPRLGVALAPARAARRMRRAVGLPERAGLLVRAVEDGSPAAAAGIEAGDLLVAANDTELGSIDVLYELLDSVASGGSLELTVLRGTEERPVTVEFEASGAAA